MARTRTVRGGSERAESSDDPRRPGSMFQTGVPRRFHSRADELLEEANPESPGQRARRIHREMQKRVTGTQRTSRRTRSPVPA